MLHEIPSIFMLYKDLSEGKPAPVMLMSSPPAKLPSLLEISSILAKTLKL